MRRRSTLLIPDAIVTRTDPPASVVGIRERIVRTIAAKGLTQRELAVRGGLAETQISAILRRLEKRPLAIELSTLSKIADGAGVSLQWLIFGDAPSH